MQVQPYIGHLREPTGVFLSLYKIRDEKCKKGSCGDGWLTAQSVEAGRSEGQGEDRTVVFFSLNVEKLTVPFFLLVADQDARSTPPSPPSRSARTLSSTR